MMEAINVHMQLGEWCKIDCLTTKKENTKYTH